MYGRLRDTHYFNDLLNCQSYHIKGAIASHKALYNFVFIKILSDPDLLNRYNFYKRTWKYIISYSKYFKSRILISRLIVFIILLSSRHWFRKLKKKKKNKEKKLKKKLEKKEKKNKKNSVHLCNFSELSWCKFSRNFLKLKLNKIQYN